MASTLVRPAAYLCLLASPGLAQTVFLSEIHYDNTGTDVGEAIEITGPAGTSLDEWTVPLYNGNGGAVYDTISLSGTIPDEGDGYGALNFSHAGIQNGSPDGLAIVDNSAEVIQFLSYEGTFTAVDGPASGLTSTSIGTESSLSSTGRSLQLVGSGVEYPDFTWTGTSVTASFGEINSGMFFCEGDDCSAPSPTPGPVSLCPEIATAISAVQGSGDSTPLAGDSVIVKGIVTSVFSALNGFYVQDAGDGDVTTSDGVFVYYGTSPTVSVGDEVAVSGIASEYYNTTEIFPVDMQEVCSTGNALPSAVKVNLPSYATFLESVEGMLVSIQGAEVTGNYNAGTYGQVEVAAHRLWQFTQTNSPGTVPDVPVGTTIIIDDGSRVTDPDPAVYVDRASDIRSGQTLDVEGIMAYSSNEYRIHPAGNGVTLAKATNPRPTNVTAKGNEYDVRVASFNVLNYFTTLNSRGAETVEQREAQLAKITAGALALDADVIGIIEVENDYAEDVPSIQVIVDSLNAAGSTSSWSYVVPTTIPLGPDVIAVGIVFDNTTVRLTGDSDVLDYEGDSTRSTLAQTFAVNCHTRAREEACTSMYSGGERKTCIQKVNDCPANFTVAVNHFKSKGSNCDDLDDPDADDGQGNCNLTRTAAMAKLIEWVTGNDIAVTKDDNILLVGDFNSYAMEDPLRTAAAGGFINLAQTSPGYPQISTFVYYGEAGTLDYILGTPSTVAARVGDMVHYHINADETSALGYYACDENDACTVALDQYRCSDHDIVVQDFRMQ